MKTRFLTLLFVLTVASPATAREGWLGSWVDLAVGVKGIGGVNIWTEPSSPPLAFAIQDVAFADARAGYGAGAGLYLDARFIKFIGLEMDLLYEFDTVWEELNDGIVKNRLKAHNLRVPLLVKGVLPLPGVRLSLGVGPEFVIPLSSSGEVEGPALYTFDSWSKTSTMLTFGLGIVVNLPFGLLLPIDLRASYNLTQPSDFSDRVPTVDVQGNIVRRVEVVYRNTWEARLLLGLGYEF